MSAPVDVVFVHGFMGSRASVRGVDVWPDVGALRRGALELLAVEAERVAFSGPLDLGGPPNAWAVLPPLRVHSFCYDWRQDIEIVAHELGRFIEAKVERGAAHVVAHGMGGLVCRSLFRQRPRLWDGLAARGLDRGGRMALVGVPNEGCFEAAAILSGEHPLPRWLDILDLKHDAEQIADVFRSFLSLYQMLPSPARCGALYDASTWQKAGIKIRAEYLDRAHAFHGGLARAAPLDPARVACIVGAGVRTRVAFGGAREPKRFGFELGLDGDGLVPASMAALPGAPAYEARGGFGALLCDGGVEDARGLRAGIAEILITGDTARLPRAVGRVASPFREQAVRRQFVEKRLFQIVHEIKPAEGGSADARFALEAERALVRAAFADEAGAEKAIDDASAAHPSAAHCQALRVKMRHDDVVRVKTPLLVVAHYAGTAPSGSEAAVDRGLDAWISRALAQRIVSANLGETFFIPVGGETDAESVLLVGKGPPGRLGLDDLRYLAINVAFTAASLKKRQIATVALGTGRGELPRESAVRAMIEGLREGLARWAKASGGPAVGADVEPFQVTVIERRKPAYDEARKALKELAESEAPWVTFEDDDGGGRFDSTPDLEAPPLGEDTTRITVEESASGGSLVYRFSALGRAASVPLHEVSVQPRFLEELTRHLQDPGADDHERLGKLFGTYLIPDALRGMFADTKGVTLVLDREAAALPWEMACVEGATRALRLGVDVKLSRQLRTGRTAAPAAAPAAHDRLDVLVIADPACGPRLALPEARREGEEVFELFEAWRRKHKDRCHIVKCIGPEESDPLAILDMILQGGFDVIHFAGHGAFDPEHPARSGWVLGDNLVLTAREMFRARRVPRLVFANACWSSAMSARTRRRPGRGLVSMAEAFMSMGVENYIGASRPVDAHLSAVLAREFYKQVLNQGCALDEALRYARHEVCELGGGTWGAFQLYGVGSTMLTPGPVSSGPPLAPARSAPPGPCE